MYESTFVRSERDGNQIAKAQVCAPEDRSATVSLYVDTDPHDYHTYWTPEEARKLAKQLLAAAREAETINLRVILAIS